MKTRLMKKMTLIMEIRPWRRPERSPLDEALQAAERVRARCRLDAKAHDLLTCAAQAEGEITTLNRIGDLLARADQIDLGITYFERVARVYADDGFWAKAIAIYQKILRYDPERDDVRDRLAFLYQQSGLPTRA